jgi:hypothetical protein
MPDMAQITNARIRGPISQNDQHSVMEFVINYTASFSSSELNQEFEDATRLLEKDDTDNDQVTPYQKPQTFVATGSAVDREYSIIVRREWVSTELGDEEVRGQVWLRRKGDGLPTDERFTANHVRCRA